MLSSSNFLTPEDILVYFFLRMASLISHELDSYQQCARPFFVGSVMEEWTILTSIFMRHTPAILQNLTTKGNSSCLYFSEFFGENYDLYIVPDKNTSVKFQFGKDPTVSIL